VLAVGNGRDEHRPDHAAHQHQRAEGTGVGGGKAARADDVFDPGGDAVKDAHTDEGHHQVQPEIAHFEGMLEPVEHQRAHILAFRTGGRGGLFAGKDQEQQR